MGIFVTLTIKPPAAVHETGGEGSVQNPCRVTNTTTHWCTPGEMLPEVESASAGPSAGPIWLTRSRFRSSNWRGKSWPVTPSLNAMYSRPKIVVEAR